MGETALVGGKYRILHELGQGGSGVVHLGLAQGPAGFSRLVVLKSLRGTLCRDDDFRVMFLNEGRLSGRLHHPNVVQVTEVLEDEGVPVIVMEYLDGHPLSGLRRSSKRVLSMEAELRVISEGLRGLHYAHELKDFDGTPLAVVHRDVTPQNLFVTYDGQVKILDFGIAKLNGSLVETQTGIVKGKLRYMPPEQVAGNVLDRRVDVFASGVMIWEAACRRRMWGTLPEVAIMKAILRGDVPKPSSVNPNVPEELERIIMKALAHQPDNRYSTVEALRLELETFLATLGNVPSVIEIGQTIAEAFAQERAQFRRNIEATLSEESFGRRGSGPSFQGGFDRDEVESSTGYIFDGSSRDDTQRITSSATTEQHSWRRYWGVGMMVVGLLAFAAFRGGEVSVEQKEPSDTSSKEVVLVAAHRSDTAAPAEEAIAPPREEAEDISFVLHVSPEGANVLLDGHELPRPFAESMTRDGKDHVLVVEAPGFVTAERTISFGEDVELNIELEKRQQRPVGGTAQRKSPSRSESSSPPPAPSCNPPYFVDGDGIKRYRPGCI